jgi:hypothetical protein
LTVLSTTSFLNLPFSNPKDKKPVGTEDPVATVVGYHVKLPGNGFLVGFSNGIL